MLQRVRNFMVLDGDYFDEELKEGKNIDYFVMRYKTSLANDITQFKYNLEMELGSEEDSLYKRHKKGN